MTTNRKPTAPTTEAIDHFCAQLDSVFSRRADRQALHHFLHDSPWDALALNKRRLAIWQKRPDLAPHAEGVLIIDATGDRKRGRGIVLAAQQYIGTLGHTANGVVSVTSHWADGKRHVSLGVRAYHPASRLALGKADPKFRTRPELAWELIEEARVEGILFRVVVADCVTDENAKLDDVNPLSWTTFRPS